MTKLLKPRRRAYLIPLILLINGVVFYQWQVNSDGDMDSFMARHFLVSWIALEEGRFWVLVTSAFSHFNFLHFFINMYVLMSFGGFMEKALGRLRFLSFYLLAGIVGSLGHSVVSNFYLHQPEQPALGASGALAGIILLFSLLFPKEKLLIFGFIPIPALFGALLFIGLDIWGLVAQSDGGGLPIGHGAHLGGAFTGIVYFLFFLRPRIRAVSRSRQL